MIFPFSILLKEAMDAQGIGAVKLEELLQEAGFEDIKRRRISEYLHQISTPGLEKAKQLFSVLEYDISESDLIDSLRENRELIRDSHSIASDPEKSEQGKIVIVRVRMRKIGPSSDALENEKKLRLRLDKLGSDMTFTKYVESLIYHDLLKEEEDHE